MSLTPEQIDRYARHLVLREVGGPGQQKLLAAKVLVIGAGGLGSPLALYLAAAGVGTIGIVDDDEVSLSNLQRQIIHQSNSIGTKKTESAKAAIEALTPDVQVIPHTERLTEENAADLIRQYTIVADGCDNFETRFLVNDTCVAEGRTLVSAAIGEFDGQIATFKPHAGNYPCYRCLYPEPPPPGAIPPCSEAGILGAVAGIVGAWQALEVIREIVGFGNSLAGKLVLFDGLGAQTRTITLPRDPACITCERRA
jgi:adenylyltransferase/sulfurtransferase